MKQLFHSADISKTRFLVTGGAGFIGSHLVDYLIEHNAALVRVADNLSTGTKDNLAHHLNNSSLEFIHCDLRNYDICEDICKDIDIILHQAAAGSVPRSIEHPLYTNDNNVSTHLNILWASVKHNVQRVVYASSSSVYGDDTHLPKLEEYLGNPLSPYAVSKRVNEMYASVFYQLYGLHVIGLRYFNVFGPRQNPQGPYAAVIPLFINALKNQTTPVIYGTGEQSRDFTYVENVVQANILAALTPRPEAYGQVFNIGAGQITTVNDLFSIIAELMSSHAKPNYLPPRKGDIFSSYASIKKANEILGYRPLIHVREGIEKTIEYFLKQ